MSVPTHIRTPRHGQVRVERVIESPVEGRPDAVAYEYKVNGVTLDIQDSDVLRTLPDSGIRTTFDRGGAAREADPTKPRLSLIRPRALWRLARHMMSADVKYADVGGARNYEKGMPFTRVLEGARRHLDDYGDRRTDEDHLVAAFWGIYALLTYEEYGMAETLDDRPPALFEEEPAIVAMPSPLDDEAIRRGLSGQELWPPQVGG